MNKQQINYQPIFKKSTRKDKKYMVRSPKGKLIHFGQLGYEHYKDNALGIYSDLDHLDKKRRDRYIARASKITNKEGELTYKNPEYSNFYAYNYLW